LKDIKRRRNINQSSQHHQQPGVQIEPGRVSDACIELGQFGLETEAERLKRDHKILMMEIARLRQKQQNSRGQVTAMEQRVQGTERKQKQMMVFLAKALKNPALVQQLLLRSEQKQQLLENLGKKRRLPLTLSFENPQASAEVEDELEIENMISTMVDSSASSSSRDQMEEKVIMESSNQNFDGINEAIWDELLDEGLMPLTGIEQGDDDKEIEVDMEGFGDTTGWGDDVQNLGDQVGSLGPSQP